MRAACSTPSICGKPTSEKNVAFRYRWSLTHEISISLANAPFSQACLSHTTTSAPPLRHSLSLARRKLVNGTATIARPTRGDHASIDVYSLAIDIESSRYLREYLAPMSEPCSTTRARRVHKISCRAAVCLFTDTVRRIVGRRIPPSPLLYNNNDDIKQEGNIILRTYIFNLFEGPSSSSILYKSAPADAWSCLVLISRGMLLLLLRVLRVPFPTSLSWHRGRGRLNCSWPLLPLQLWLHRFGCWGLVL